MLAQLHLVRFGLGGIGKVRFGYVKLGNEEVKLGKLGKVFVTG